MSLQKAIDILQDFQDRYEDNWDKDFYDGFIVAKTVLNSREIFDNRYPSYQPSQDTQYKKDLTKWIERQRYNRHWGRDKHISTWASTSATICPHITEEGQG